MSDSLDLTKYDSTLKTKPNLEVCPLSETQHSDYVQKVSVKSWMVCSPPPPGKRQLTWILRQTV